MSEVHDPNLYRNTACPLSCIISNSNADNFRKSTVFRLTRRVLAVTAWTGALITELTSRRKQIGPVKIWVYHCTCHCILVDIWLMSRLWNGWTQIYTYKTQQKTTNSHAQDINYVNPLHFYVQYIDYWSWIFNGLTFFSPKVISVFVSRKP